jgi:hypothetical protein
MRRLGLPLVEININTESDRRGYITALKKSDQGDLSVLELLLSTAVNAE